MLGFIAAVVSYATSGSVFFFGSTRVLMTETIFTVTSVAFFVLLSYSIQQLSETY